MDYSAPGSLNRGKGRSHPALLQVRDSEATSRMQMRGKVTLHPWMLWAASAAEVRRSRHCEVPNCARRSGFGPIQIGYRTPPLHAAVWSFFSAILCGFEIHMLVTEQMKAESRNRLRDHER